MKVSANGHCLLDDYDQPFFHLADTSWTLLYKPIALVQADSGPGT